MTSGPSLSPIIPCAVAHGATYFEAASELRASGQIAEDDFRLAPKLSDSRDRLPQLTTQVLETSHAAIAGILERADMRNPGTARMYKAKRAAHATLT
ncbi:hypothetical protein RA2_04354 [Roseovarius sp. A-2]|nr:hypothetical protein RA2_04354 [Roseovarius sp. A-2]